MTTETICEHEGAVYLPTINDIACPNESCEGITPEEASEIIQGYYDAQADYDAENLINDERGF